MTGRQRAHLLRVLRGAGLALTRESAGLYVGRCPNCGGRLEVHLRAPSPDLALCCRGRVDILVGPKEAARVH